MAVLSRERERDFRCECEMRVIDDGRITVRTPLELKKDEKKDKKCLLALLIPTTQQASTNLSCTKTLS